MNRLQEQYLKSLMNGMTPEEIQEVICKAESKYTAGELCLLKADAKSITRILDDMDARIAEYRNRTDDCPSV